MKFKHNISKISLKDEVKLFLSNNIKLQKIIYNYYKKDFEFFNYSQNFLI